MGHERPNGGLKIDDEDDRRGDLGCAIVVMKLTMTHGWSNA